MKIKIFSVFDAQLRQYMTPHFYMTAGAAERAFKKGVNQDGGFDPAEDFTMFEIGEFDDETGEIVSHTAPIRVVSAISLKDIKPVVN